MIISHKNKFIFIHLHKCSGTSITLTLLPYLGPDDIIMGCTDEYEELSNRSRRMGSVWKHSRAQEIREFVGERTWREYFVFSFVRNPWDVVLSKYFWWQKTEANWNEQALASKMKFMSMTFDEYVQDSLKERGAGFLEYLESHGPGSNVREMDINYIGYTENVRSHFKILLKMIGFKDIKIMRTNTSYEMRKRKSYNYYYNHKSMEDVGNYYKKDINYFNFKFNYNLKEKLFSKYKPIILERNS